MTHSEFLHLLTKLGGPKGCGAPHTGVALVQDKALETPSGMGGTTSRPAPNPQAQPAPQRNRVQVSALKQTKLATLRKEIPSAIVAPPGKAPAEPPLLTKEEYNYIVPLVATGTSQVVSALLSNGVFPWLHRKLQKIHPLPRTALITAPSLAAGLGLAALYQRHSANVKRKHVEGYGPK